MSTDIDSGRNWFCCKFRVFSFLSVKVRSWYKNHSKIKNLASVQCVSILSVPRIRFRPVKAGMEKLKKKRVHKTMMYTVEVGFTILNNLIRDRGFDCNCIINGTVVLQSGTVSWVLSG